MLMLAAPPTPLPAPPAAELHAGDPVRLTERHESLPFGAEGRVVGFYRLDPPQALVAFDAGPCAVLESALERIG